MSGLLKRRWKLLCVLAAGCVALVLLASWIAGSTLCAPCRASFKAPTDLAVESVSFTNSIGGMIHGWLVRGEPGRGVVILMHGVRANRTETLGRARFLSRAGFAVLLFDFQAHGESQGKHITFGHLESLDAAAAVTFAHREYPREKIGTIGISLGGAAVALAVPPLPVDAVVLESVYPTIEEAVGGRMRRALGPAGGLLAPLLLWQIQPRLGFDARELRPIDKLEFMPAPKLFIAGTRDRHTKIGEARRMLSAAAGPKELWEVEGAAHEDLHEFNRPEYERRVLRFLTEHLAR